MDLEEAKTALEALPGVHRVDISTRNLPFGVKFKVYCTDPDITHEEMQQAIQKVQEIEDSLTIDMGCAVDIKAYGPRSREE